ncbi:MAG: diaminopimelate epimerase [Armatimonadota bacterium]|nr:diaminopimelate epimerase [bacterium]MDW8320938.1 diaminopimelate epimerase [Armatimonadota bacterium]
MQFTKMHGIGNDFVVLDCLKSEIAEESLPDIARRLCDRRFGIGADGLILVLPSRVAHLRMRMFNPDGSEAEMCGNGIRCFAKYAYDRKHVTSPQMSVETLAGVKSLKLGTQGGKVATVTVDMGLPRLAPEEIPVRVDGAQSVIGYPLRAAGKKLEFTAVSMGNPHAVIFLDNVASFPVEKVGPEIENHKLFPKRTNVQFVQVVNSREIILRTWERGAGLTLACGTGACASVVAGVLNKLTSREVLVHLPGGDLQIEWLGDGRVLMTGPATEVFVGEIDF